MHCKRNLHVCCDACRLKAVPNDWHRKDFWCGSLCLHVHRFPSEPRAHLMLLLDTEAVGVSIVLQDELLKVEECALVLHMLPHLQEKVGYIASQSKHANPTRHLVFSMHCSCLMAVIRQSTDQAECVCSACMRCLPEPYIGITGKCRADIPAPLQSTRWGPHWRVCSQGTYAAGQEIR